MVVKSTGSAVQQKLTQLCKSIILQKKKNTGSEATQPGFETQLFHLLGQDI